MVYLLFSFCCFETYALTTDNAWKYSYEEHKLRLSFVQEVINLWKLFYLIQ
jgi:hypothetical protein